MRRHYSFGKVPHRNNLKSTLPLEFADLNEKIPKLRTKKRLKNIIYQNSSILKTYNDQINLIVMANVRQNY